ncbi:MAG: hypothetical protein IPO27_10555 [Bacteroidetes bacterium]|nr:hypothetical protein [Bacteroidota bacterium]
MRSCTKIILIAAYAFISCNIASDKAASQVMTVASATDTIRYQCPMKCESDTAYTAAGQCPVCKMDLEKLP